MFEFLMFEFRIPVKSRIWLRLAAGLAAFLLGPALCAHAEARHLCATPEALIHLREGLPRTEERILRNEPVTILAIGSSSTAGVGASSPAFTYPNQLAQELRRRLPGLDFRVINKGVGSEEAPATVARFERDVLPENPDLVIWQVGTNDALHDEDIALYHEAMKQGIDALQAAGIDILIMDLQYAPQILAHPLYRQIEQEISALGREEGTPVFHRFAIMHHWLTSDGLDFKAMLSPDGLHMNDLSYSCLGQLLAEAITDRVAVGVGRAVIALHH